MAAKSTKSIPEKLHLKPGQILVVIAAPEGYPAMLGPLPHGCRLVTAMTEGASVVQLFVRDMEDLRGRLDEVRGAIGNAALWVTYPKASSGIQTDLNRDIIWAYVRGIGFDAVSIFSLDENWAALRLKAVPQAA